MKTLKILVATHKDYIFPKDKSYYPIQLGKETALIDLDILSDNLGDNISTKNHSFCELTALYWAYKNHFIEDSDFIGIVHYRRYFKGNRLSLKGKRISSGEELLNYMEAVDCLAPKKRNYYIETVYSHYKNAHYINDLEQTKKIICNKYPEYLIAFNKVMERRTLHLYNMFIMSKKNTERYCNWLFDILFELEKCIDTTYYDKYQKRVYGFIAERLFNVWVEHNKISIRELAVINLENEYWVTKILNFLKRKLLN